MQGLVDHDGRWREYLAEAAALALFMISASVFGTMLEHRESPVQQLVQDPMIRRAIMGVAMAFTLAAIVYSPLGARSGAHMNPSVTLAFARLTRIRRADAGFYIAAQFLGAVIGMLVSYALIGRMLGEPAVDFIQTRPGGAGVAWAILGELAISFVMMSIVLRVAAHPRFMRCAGLAAAVLLFLNITFEAPLSGMSMNPARSLAPALLAGRYDALWVYFVAPPLGMLLAAEWFLSGRRQPPCAKLNHAADVRCIFCGHVPHSKDTHPCITT